MQNAILQQLNETVDYWIKILDDYTLELLCRVQYLYSATAKQTGIICGTTCGKKRASMSNYFPDSDKF